MSFLLDFLDLFNLIDRLEGFFARFAHADWGGAAGRSNGAGLVSEFGRTALGANSWTFRVPRDCEWTGTEIERYLRKYGIVVWGRRVTGNFLIFSVKERQANWAEYLLLRRGIPLNGRTFNDLNPEYGRAHAPGDSPPAWVDNQSKSRRRR